MAITTETRISLLSRVYHYANTGSEEDRDSLKQLVSLYLHLDDSSPQVIEISNLLKENVVYHPDKICSLALEAIKALTIPPQSTSPSCSRRPSFSSPMSRRFV